ncbi:MAG: hypothetical protein ACXVLX_15490 [Ilumatobacteraceae bacterium]
MRRELLGAGLIAAVVLAPAQPAFAHGGNGGRASDYRIEVTGYEGNPSGITVRPVELGNRMELTRTTAKEVQILGYDKEPYLRLDSTGVFENINSPAHYLNLDRFARTPIPPTASAKAQPNWVKLGNGTSIRWHDHRTHWMDTVPPPEVRADPGVERVIFAANRVDLVVDGKPVVAIVEVTWLPPPPRLIWLVITSLAGCVLLAAFVLMPRVRKFGPACASVAAIAGLVGSGASKIRIIAGGVLIVVAVIGWIIRNRWLPVGAAVAVVILSVTHFEVFEHRLLAGWAPAGLQRLGITVALALAAAVVGAELVAGLGATTSMQPARIEP